MSVGMYKRMLSLNLNPLGVRGGRFSSYTSGNRALVLCASRQGSGKHASANSQRLPADELISRRFSQYAASSSQEVPPALVNQYSKRLILVDAHALLYRSHFGFRGQRLETSRGEDTSISYGFLSTVLRLLEIQEPPTHFAVVMDHHGKTFRHEMYNDYKAQRPPMPDAMKLAIPKIQQLLQILGIPVMRVAGVEADDVIGTVATRAHEEGFVVAIASPDKDFFQVLRPGLQLLRPPKKDELGSAGIVAGFVGYSYDAFKQEYGIEPEQWVDVLALMGDSSDNVPGVPGVGAKGALALIQQYGSVESVLQNAQEVKRKQQREQLSSMEGAQKAHLSKRLVEIQTDVDLPPVRIPWDNLLLRAPPEKRLQDIERALGELEFRQHAQRFTKLWEAMRAAQQSAEAAGVLH